MQASNMLRRRVAQQHRAFRAGSCGPQHRPVVANRTAQRAIVKAAAAAVETAPAEQEQVQAAQAVADIIPGVEDADLAELELQELEQASEDALGWLLTHTEEEQEQDLDEMVDYDEFGDDEYAELFGQVESMIESSYSDIRVGDRLVGTVYEISDEGAYVEVGEKATGFVPLAECSFAKLKTPLEVLRVGMTREFVVINKEDEDGQLVLSLAAVEASIMWLRMKQMQLEKAIVNVKVESANKGGLLVHYGPFDGFLPVGQFGSSITLETMESLVGSELPVQFLDVDEEGERLVFTNKKLGMEGAVAAPVDIKMGDVVQGVVQIVKPYGVFVDIGGLTGLLHVSQISNDRVTTLDKIFNEGDKIKVMVLSMDRERSRVTLSTKKLEVTKGDMLRNPQLVYEKAEEQAAIFKSRMEATALTLQQANGTAAMVGDQAFAGAV